MFLLMDSMTLPSFNLFLLRLCSVAKSGALSSGLLVYANPLLNGTLALPFVCLAVLSL